jgi:glutathione S-transferase
LEREAMALTLYFHPLSSYCQKALIALYEHATPFTPHLLDLMNAEVRAAHAQRYPLGKMPVLQDDARGHTVVEATIVIEYLELHHAGANRLIPTDPELAWQVRMLDRRFDLYVNDPVGVIVLDKLRPAAQRDPISVERARATLATVYGMIDREMADRTWAAGPTFTMADCAAAPALFYADKLAPLGEHRHAAAYLARLRERPSFARALTEAAPYLAMFPA